FPTCVAHLAILGRILVEHGIRVVDVYIDFTWGLEMRQLGEAAGWRGYGNMSHLLRGFAAALRLDQFVIAPESAIEEEHVVGIGLVSQCFIQLRICRHVREPLASGRIDD